MGGLRRVELCAAVLSDEKDKTAAGFLRRAVAWFASMGITVERVLFDNVALTTHRPSVESTSSPLA